MKTRRRARQRIALHDAGEKDVRRRRPGERRTVRQVRSVGVLAEPRPRAKLARVRRRGQLAQAVRHALARWGGLTCRLDDGGIEIDSKTVERSIRPLALNGKTALFAGSDGGGDPYA